MAQLKQEPGIRRTRAGTSRTITDDSNIPIRAPSTASSTSEQTSNRPFAEATSSATLHNVTPPLSQDDGETAAPPSPATMTNGTDHDVDMDGRGTSQDAMEILGARSRQLIQAIRNLENLDIDATIPSLPKIVVVGDQSAGKSSLVEGICDISLPRDQGTCTRVPIQITTTASVWNNSPWTAKISLQCSYSYLPKERGSKLKYAKWGEVGSLETFHFATIFDKADLNLALRRAQLALLNPNKDPASFVNKDITNDHEFLIGFSPNVISLEIAAPNLSELSFFDLPGAINTTPKEEDTFLVGFIETLLRKYMSDEKALILLACPANQDMETSTANKYLRLVKAERRSAGVLTKPDLMEKTAFHVNTIRKMFDGQVYKLGHGWFMARQLSQDELHRGVEHEEAREMEKQFFSSSPWTDKLGAYANRFGIQNLQTELSQKLTQHILNDLPEIVGRVESRLQEVTATLATFPEPSADPCMVVYLAIEKLIKSVQYELGANSANSVFRGQYRNILQDLRDIFRDARPRVNLNTPGYQQPVVSIDSSDEEQDEEESPSKRSKTNAGCATTPSQQRHFTPAGTPASQRQRKVPVHQLIEAPSPIVFKLDQVKRDYDSAPGADISGQTSNTVDEKLRLQPLSTWLTIANMLLAKVEESFKRMLNDALKTSLSTRSATLLYRSAAQSQLAFFMELLLQQRVSFEQRVTIERHRAMTLDGTISSKETLERTKLITSRREHRAKEQLQILEQRLNKTMSSPEQVKKYANDAKWVADNIGEDPFQREVEAMAKPLAYYDIASTQLLDTFVRQLDYELLHTFSEQLLARLLVDLKVTNQAHCAALLAEDEQRERLRVSLEMEKGRLLMALEELKALPDVHG